MSIDANEQNPVTQNAPDTGSISGAPGASSPDDMRLNQSRQAPPSPSAPSAPSPSAVTGAASTLSGPDTRSRDQYGYVPELKTRDASQVVAPVQKSPADIQADQKHLSFVDRINQGAKQLAFGGNPPMDYKVLPDGTLQKTPRQVPARYAWLSLVMGMLAGGASGMSEHGPGSVGRSFLAGQQQARQLQEQQKAANEQRQEQASHEFVRRAQVTENNFRMRQLAMSLSDHDMEHNQTAIKNFKPMYDLFYQAGAIVPGTEQGISEEDLIKQYGPKATENNGIPVAAEFVRDPNAGEEIQDSQGVSKVRFRYAVINQSKAVGLTVTPEQRERMQYWGLVGWTKQDGSPQIQGDMKLNGPVIYGGAIQAQQLDTAQHELEKYSQQTTGKSLDPNFLRDAIKNNASLRTNIVALERYEGAGGVDAGVNALMKDDPQAAAKVRAVYNSIYPLDKFAEDRQIRIAAEKKDADITPTNAQTVKNDPKESQERRTLADKVLKGEVNQAGAKAGAEADAKAKADAGLADDYLRNLSAGAQAQLRSINEGRTLLSTLPRGKEKTKIMQALAVAYPDFDQSKGETWGKTRNEYMGSGQTAKKVVSYNTALEHMADLYDHSAYEGIYIPGTKDYSDRSVALNYVANEVGNAIKNGVMTQKEGDEILGSLKGWTPGTAKERTAETARLLNDKIDEYQRKFQEASPSPAIQAPVLLSPRASNSYEHVVHGKPLSQAQGSGASQPSTPKVGDIVTVKGQSIKVTGISPNGQLQGVPVQQ